MSSLGRAGRELKVQLLLDRIRPIVVALSEIEVKADDNIVFKNSTQCSTRLQCLTKGTDCCC